MERTGRYFFENKRTVLLNTWKKNNSLAKYSYFWKKITVQIVYEKEQFFSKKFWKVFGKELFFWKSSFLKNGTVLLKKDTIIIIETIIVWKKNCSVFVFVLNSSFRPKRTVLLDTKNCSFHRKFLNYSKTVLNCSLFSKK